MLGKYSVSESHPWLRMGLPFDVIPNSPPITWRHHRYTMYLRLTYIALYIHKCEFLSPPKK
jgi:hypothetical protein